MRRTFSLNDEWRFHRGDIARRNVGGIHEERYASAEWMKAGNMGVAKPTYPDGEWEAIDLPHDFVVEASFSPDADLTHGSHPTDVGWYRKTFVMPEGAVDKPVWLEFDGVYRDCQVWMNGNFVGRNLSGYLSFDFDVSDLCLHDGQPNTIAVRADAREFELWSYEGGGIYRDVRMVIGEPVHIEPNGLWVRTETHAQEGSDGGDAVEVVVQANIRNARSRDAGGQLRIEVLDHTGDAVTTAQDAFEIDTAQSEITELRAAIVKPRRWSPSDPYLYTLKATIEIAGAAIDVVEVPFGVRDIAFTADRGMLLNGQPLKLKGVCNHQDHAGVGVAIPEALDLWRVRQLKKMGCNAIRTSHNPPTPKLLDICDREGVLVMDEARMVGSSKEILGQLRRLIHRDRNHACVFAWSIGNEEMAVQNTEIGVRQMRRMQDLCHREDPTRPVTYAMNCHWLNIAKTHHDMDFHLDVYGANYVCREQYNNDGKMYDEFHELYPDWPLLATETGGSASVRGLYSVERPDLEHQTTPIWSNPKRKNLVSAYGETYTPWGYSVMETWQDCINRPFVGGTFVWTGFDYRGETYPMKWPAVNTGYGLMDLCGFPKDAFHYYRAWWQDEPALHVFPHWNWEGQEGAAIDVVCYSNLHAVELFVNGESQGKQTVPENDCLRWSPTYAPGKLEAIGFDARGRKVSKKTIETTGATASVRLTADRATYRADGEDVVVATVAAVDAEGRFVATAGEKITFATDGPITILGVGNGDPLSHEADKASERRLFHGLCQVLLRVTREPGTAVLHASGDGIQPVSLNLSIEAADVAPWIPSMQDPAALVGSATKTAVDDAL